MLLTIFDGSSYVKNVNIFDVIEKQQRSHSERIKLF